MAEAGDLLPCAGRFLVILLFCICGWQNVQAEETDEFTLPPRDLTDSGPIVSKKLYEVIQSVIDQTNSEIQMLIPIAQYSRFAALRLATRRSDVYLADLIYKHSGPGFPRWLRGNLLSNKYKSLHYRETRPWKTIYWLAFSQSPLSLIGLAPTINLYNYYFGTDKLNHFFMQGHTYYTIYTYYLAKGKSAFQAHNAMITYGKIIEQTYLGTLVNGIYSNGDLSANYAGWKFYMNLAHSVAIGDRTLPPMLVLNKGQWEFSKTINKNELLKPYLSNNLSEALNPSRYAFTRGQIRKQVNKRCFDWIQRRGLTQSIAESTYKENSLWHGEEYGHWLPEDNKITLNTCFGGK